MTNRRDVRDECPGQACAVAPQTDPYGVGSRNQMHTFRHMSIITFTTSDKKDPAQGRASSLTKRNSQARRKLSKRRRVAVFAIDTLELLVNFIPECRV